METNVLKILWKFYKTPRAGIRILCAPLSFHRSYIALLQARSTSCQTRDGSPFYLNHMSDQLSELDWQELTDLITTAPPERIRLAVSRVNASSAPATVLITEVDRLLHLATISSGDAFDRALLGELRRLSIH